MNLMNWRPFLVEQLQACHAQVGNTRSSRGSIDYSCSFMDPDPLPPSPHTCSRASTTLFFCMMASPVERTRVNGWRRTIVQSFRSLFFLSTSSIDHISSSRAPLMRKTCTLGWQSHSGGTYFYCPLKKTFISFFSWTKPIRRTLPGLVTVITNRSRENKREKLDGCL